MLPSSDRAVYSSKFGFHDGKTLVSYVPKPRNAVILLSTQHHDNSVATDEKAKPDIIHYYNSTTSGVDVLDKVVRTYSCKRATARWTVAFFLNMIDIAAYNALVLWITRNEQWNQGKSCARREFLRELGMQLVSSHAAERASLPSSRRRRIREAARRSGISGVIASERSERSTAE